MAIPLHEFSAAASAPPPPSYPLSSRHPGAGRQTHQQCEGDQRWRGAPPTLVTSVAIDRQGGVLGGGEL